MTKIDIAETAHQIMTTLPKHNTKESYDFLKDILDLVFTSGEQFGYDAAEEATEMLIEDGYYTITNDH